MAIKVVELNLENGMPTVDRALVIMKNALATYKGQGIKAVIIIHGYGSSGVGGTIKSAVLKALGESSMRGIVRSFVGGEHWYARKKEILSYCGALEGYQRRIDGNEGVTVVILR